MRVPRDGTHESVGGAAAVQLPHGPIDLGAKNWHNGSIAAFWFSADTGAGVLRSVRYATLTQQSS